VVLGLIGGGGWFAYSWTQKQYFVGTDGDYVAIYKGVDQVLPGLNLSSLYEKQALQVDKLPTYNREQVEGTIQADDLAAARQIISELERAAAECAAKPNPKPTITPKPSTPVSTPPKPPATTPASTPVSTPASTPSNGTVNPDDCDGVK
jgi:protein phosphatase